MGKWLATLIATVIGGVLVGVLVWVITQAFQPEPEPPPTPRPPTREPSFLEKVAGNYTLSSWSEANRTFTLGVRIVEGTLEINGSGSADWTVLLEQTLTPDPGRASMTARGTILLDSHEVVGVIGGEFNKTHMLDNKWGKVSSDVELAVRGWGILSPEDRFKLSLDTQRSGRQLLQMKNSRGTFTWIK